jgi:tetratricopeptide (TPR) repeat protein
MGEYQKAQAHYEKGVLILERTRIYPFWANMWKVSLARSKVLNNDLDIKLSKIFDYHQKIGVRVHKGWAARHVAEILLNIDDQHISEAEGWVEKAIETDKRNYTMWSLGGNYALYAQLFRRKGDRLKAKKNLAKAIDIFKECGADGWVKKHEEEMAALS